MHSLKGQTFRQKRAGEEWFRLGPSNANPMCIQGIQGRVTACQTHC